jgi:DNA ligase (NAD+)
MDPLSDLNRIYSPKTIKIKKNTLKNPDEPPKPKRKYTRKILPQNMDITMNTAIAPNVEEPKPKRKYTRKAKLEEVVESIEPVDTTTEVTQAVIEEPVIKIKRKYTRKNKTNKEEPLIIEEMPRKAVNPSLNIETVLSPIKTAPVVPAAPAPTTQPMYFAEEKPKRLNESFVELMDDLGFIMRQRKDKMRARAYSIAKETIQTYDGDITDPVQLKGKPGIGNTIYQKLIDYNKTGTLKILEEEKDTVIQKRAMEIFTNIYGVGEKKAEELVLKGVTSLDQLRQRQMELLNDKQRIGLEYYHDILERIPRAEIVRYETIFRESITPEISDLKLQIVGSYRRGLESSGDIDVILTSENPGHFIIYIDNLLKKNIILEVLSRGPSKCLVITKLPDEEFARRVDFLYTPPREFPFSILYFTGSKGFNTAMREYVLGMKYTLNEHGLSHMVGRTKGALVDHDFPDEKSIFDFLNLEYKKPEDRIDGKAVVVKTGTVVDAPIVPVVSENAEVPQNIQIAVEEPESTPVVAEMNVSEPLQSNAEEVTEAVILSPVKKRRITKKRSPKIDETLENRPALVILEAEPPTPSMAKSIGTKDVCKLTKKETLQHISNFKMNGIQVLEALDEPALTAMLEAANTAFHCKGKPIMTDAEYDILHEYIEKRYPQNPALENVGATVEKNKAVLPYEMWSMDKIKPDSNALDEWKKKYTGPYVISCKLDGVSGLYTTEGPKPKLYTRGDGRVGQDISYLIPFLKLPEDKNIVIRGEFVIKKDIFNQKYEKTFANARNLVAGIANAKTLDKRIYDVDFVAYEIIKPDQLQPSKQMSILSTMNVIVVQNKNFTDITNESLSTILQDWRQNYMYEIDGIIVSNDRIYPRISGNPDHSFAFKMVLSDQIAETHVVGVEWNASKDGYLKPRVRLDPVKLGGVTIEYATGFNAEFISKNRIGVGAIVKIIRSGDVIPYIKEVTAPAEHTMMPTVPYRWNDTHVDILLENIEDDEEVREKLITAFFKTLSVDGIGPGNVKKMIHAGFDSIPKILHMKEEDFLKVGGFQLKTAQKLQENIRAAIDRATVVDLMVASNKFGRGFGNKKIELIMESYPDVLKPEERKVDRIAAISGMSRVSAKDFVDHIPQFFDFMRECGLEEKLMQKISMTPHLDQSKKPDQPENSVLPDEQPAQTGILSTIYNMFVKPKDIDTSHPLYGKTVVISGFTDKNKELENKLKYVGAKLGSSVSKKTAALVVKSEDEHTGKWLAAKENDVPIFTLDKFMIKFFQKEGIQEVEHPV